MALGEKAATTVVEPPRMFERPAELKQSERIKALFAGRSSESAKPEKPSRAGDAADTSRLESAIVEKPRETAAEDTESTAEKNAPLEVMSAEETHEAFARIAEADRAEIAAKAEAAQEVGPEADTGTAAEDAAELILLDTMEAKLAADPEKTVAEAAAEAEAEVTEHIEQVAEAAQKEAAGEDAPEEGPEGPGEAPETGSEGEVPLEAEAEDSIVLHPTPPPGASTGAGGGSVPPSRPGSGSGGASGSGGGGSGSGGGVPPYGSYPGGAGMPPFGPGGPGGAGFNAAPTPPYAGTPGPNYNAAPQVIEVQDITAERRATARGVLVGGIVGYLIGRRRGRIKTEKRLLPIQKKLEKQVDTLQETVALREQSVRKLAREKAEAMAASKAAQARFAERLAIPRAEITPLTAAVAARAESGIAGSRSERSDSRRAERFTGGIIEVPAVILAAAATLRPDRARQTSREAAAPAIDFSKKIETFSPQELDNAAEKIRVDGVTLKELARAHNLDERAMRRVVGEFITGGNVKEALTREMVQKEMQFERDPKLRKDGKAGGSGSSSGASAASVAADSNDTDNEPDRGPSNKDASKAASGTKKPTPNQATLDKLRKQQMTQVGVLAATVAVIVAVIAILLA